MVLKIKKKLIVQEIFLFNLFLNKFITVAVTIYTRYREVQELDKITGTNNKVEKLNKKSLWIGLLSSFGVSIVGNFQETNVFVIHVLGAFLAFGIGTVYICMQVRKQIVIKVSHKCNLFTDHCFV